MNATRKRSSDSAAQVDFGDHTQWGHPEPFPYVVPAVDAVAEADKRAHLTGAHPRPLPSHLSVAPLGPRAWKRDEYFEAFIAAIMRKRNDRYCIDTRNILASYKGGLEFLHGIPLIDAIGAFIEWYERERAVEVRPDGEVNAVGPA